MSRQTWNLGVSTRTSNRDKANKKGPQTTVPDATAGYSPVSSSLSPTLDRQLPPENQNKPSLKTVSMPSLQAVDKNLVDTSLGHISNNSSSVKPNSSSKPNSEYQYDPNTLAPTEKVGDNRALSCTGDTPLQESPPIQNPPPQTPKDPYFSSPEDPWHLTFTELREMRSRMTTLDRLEKVTGDLAQQLIAISKKATTIETKVIKNSAQIKEVNNDVTGLRKEVEQQHKNSQCNTRGLTEVRREVLQVKEMGKNITGLRKEMEKQHKDNQHISKEFKDIKKEVLQVREIGKEITGIRKEVDKQYKETQHKFKDLKDIKKEINLIKDVSKDMTKLREEALKRDKDIQQHSKDLMVLKDFEKEFSQMKERGHDFVSVRKDLDVQQKSIQINSDVLKGMEEEIKGLRQMLDEHQNTIQNVHKVKDDFTKTSHKSVGEMNKLVEAQKAQVMEFRTIRTNFQQDAQKQKVLFDDFKSLSEDRQKDTQQQVKQISEDLAYKKLKDQAFNIRYNLIIIGLPEHESGNAFSRAKEFFKTDLKLRKRIEVQTAYRIGQLPSEGNPYIRPLIVKFTNLPDRNLVWRHRRSIPQIEGNQKIRIQADLPKQLRDDTTTLYKVLHAASSMDEFQSARIRDYAFSLNGKLYTPLQLEQLPYPIRPSSLAIKQSNETFVFFTKFCALSNHFPSTFTIQDKEFHSMEHYLAFERAKLSEQDHLIQKAWHAKDPVESKSILNLLRDDHVQEWQNLRADITIKGLRAKFSQNQHLLNFLKNTGQRRIGEASKNPVWGVGMTLEDDHILDTTKWIESGNLLGNLLMQLRTELTATG